MTQLRIAQISHPLIVFGLTFTAGCASLHSSQCKEGNWEHIGKVDGLQGRPAEFIENHRQACRPLTINEEAYELGRLNGLASFCRPAEAFRAGKSGQPYFGVCQGPQEVEFKKHFEEGRKVFLLQQQKAELAQQIQSEKARISSDESVLNHTIQALNLLSGTSATESLDQKKQAISEEIYAIESTSPVDADPHRLALSQSSSFAYKQSLGAMTGTLFGFGTGHAIQGRYFRDGWIWTLTDVAAISAMVALNNSYCESQRLADGSRESTCRNAWPGISIFAFVGLRIWQTINLWSYLSGSEYRAQSTLFINPQGLVFTHSF